MSIASGAHQHRSDCVRPLNSTHILLIALATLTALSSCSSGAAASTSQSVHVHDGDTLTIDATRWRLWGVDAVELDQICQGRFALCGVEARDHLRALIAGHSVTCEPRGRSYDRVVGLCRAHGVDLSAAQVAAGHALDYPRYSHGRYADEEAGARAAVRGIWAGDFVTPEQWRKRAAKRQSTAAENQRRATSRAANPGGSHHGQ